MQKISTPHYYGCMILNQLWEVLRGEEFQNSSGYISQTQAWLSSVWTGFLQLLLEQTAIFLKWGRCQPNMEDFRMRIDEMASRYGGQLRLYRISSLRQLKRGRPPPCLLVEVLTMSQLKHLQYCKTFSNVLGSCDRAS